MSATWSEKPERVVYICTEGRPWEKCPPLCRDEDGMGYRRISIDDARQRLAGGWTRARKP